MNLKKLLPIALCSVLIFGSCDDDDDLVNVPNAVEAGFTSRYPSTNVSSWEMEGNLFKAEFYTNGIESEAWFQSDGTWVKTETDFHGVLPEPVQTCLNENYPGFHIDDIDWVETPTGNYFLFELEKGHTELFVKIAESGQVLK